ncbi:MAG: ATPase [Ruminococcus sp.]|nr:ATPase [Ruminococcus sp.]
MQKCKTNEYFLGCVTRGGFTTSFKSLIDKEGWFTYILKGGAGTGKSTLMKRIYKELDSGSRALFHCSSDPDSLDAVVLDDYKTIVVDGTAPHTFDPDLPAIKQVIVNLGDCWNEESLQKSADGIKKAVALNRSYLGRSGRYVCALSDICFDTYSLGSEALDRGGIKALAERIEKRVITGKGTGSGEIGVRQLSAVTMEGFKTYADTLLSCGRVYRFTDDSFAASAMLLDELAQYASARGYDVILCVTQLLGCDVTEHIIIPELDAAFMSVNKLTDIGRTGRAVNLSKYYDEQMMTQKAPRLRLNRSAARTLTDEAAKTLTLAKQAHDEIEKYYISAMDFSAIDRVGDRLIAKIADRKALM